jgi:hypothetical protein
MLGALRKLLGVFESVSPVNVIISVQPWGGDGIRCMFNREWVGVSVVLSGYGGNVSTAPLDPFAKTFGF